MLSSDNIPHISPVILLFGQILQTRHQNVVVAQEVWEQCSREYVTETTVRPRVKSLHFYRDLKPLSGTGGKSEETVFKAVYHYVLLVQSNYNSKQTLQPFRNNWCLRHGQGVGLNEGGGSFMEDMSWPSEISTHCINSMSIDFQGGRRIKW